MFIDFTIPAIDLYISIEAATVSVIGLWGENVDSPLISKLREGIREIIFELYFSV